MTDIDSRIELAFGADLTANPATWTWTDVSMYALESVKVQPGRTDESAQTQPASCAFKLDNVDGRFTPRLPTSPYWPNVRRQTPVRASINPGTGFAQRFQGYVAEFVPTWPSGNSDNAQVEVVASGSLRRLGQGNKLLASPMRRSISTAGPVAYWPMEEPAGSTQIFPGLPGGTPMVTTGAVTFGQDNIGLPGTKSTLKLGADGYLAGAVSHTFAGHWQVDWFTHIPAPLATDTTVMRVWTANGTVAFWDFIQTFSVVPAVRVRGYDPNGVVLVDSGLFASSGYQTSDWQHLRLMAHDIGGGNIQYLMVSFPIFGNGGSFGGTFAGTLGDPYYVQVPAQANLADASYAHLAVYDNYNYSATDFSARGWIGETPSGRISRLCTENGVTVAITGTSTTTMGAQTAGTFLSLLRECEAVDGGILYDGENAGLSYLAQPARCNLPVAMALDCELGQVTLPFAPIEDDQRVRNDWTITRTGGSTAQYTDPVHIAANGLYDDSATVNVQADSALLDQASWRVHMGTVEEMRVPGVSLQLNDRPELWTAWLAMTVGERLTAVNLPTQYPPGMLDMVLEGYVETWDAVTWKVDANTGPFAPFRIFTLAATTGDVTEFVGHLDTDDSALNAAITTTTASYAVKTNAGPIWTTVADDFPFDINVGGEQIRVDSITGGSSPQTFNVTRSRNGVVKAHLINAPVSLWAPLVLAM